MTYSKKAQTSHNKKPRQKTCKVCKEKFTPTRDLQPTCDKFECMAAYANKTLKRNQDEKRKEQTRRKRELDANHIPTLHKKAQKAFNEYIRLRDGKTCISCGYQGEGRQFHAGHYRSQGGNYTLRYDEQNVHAQCSICNNHLSGNLANYRMALIDKIGVESVLRLEETNTVRKWAAEELREIISTYKQKIMDMS